MGERVGCRKKEIHQIGKKKRKKKKATVVCRADETQTQRPQ